MILQLIILWILIVISPLVPPILVPLSYSYTGILLAQQINPRIISIVSVGASTLWVIIIRKLQHHIIMKLTIQEKIKGNNIFVRIINIMNSYFKKQERLARISLKWEQYIERRTGRITTFIFAIFCYIPVIPDIIGTRILYKKIKLPYLIIAVIIGKSTSHIPFIFLGKTLIQLLGIGVK